MAKSPTKMVDGVVVDATDADMDQMEADRAASVGRPRQVPLHMLITRLAAAGKLAQFSRQLAQNNPELLLQLTAQPSVLANDATVRAILTASGANPDTILA